MKAAPSDSCSQCGTLGNVLDLLNNRWSVSGALTCSSDKQVRLHSSAPPHARHVGPSRLIRSQTGRDCRQRKPYGALLTFSKPACS